MSVTDLNQPNDTASSRSWLPSPGCLFSVTLLVTLTSVVFWVGWRVHRQQARLEYFRELRAQFAIEPARPAWLYNFTADTLGAEHAAGFTDIVYLNVGSRGITDAGLHHLAGLPNLQRLSLDSTEITDVGLQELSGLTNLQWLTLDGTLVTDAGLQHLNGVARLEILELRCTKISDDGLQHLSGLTNLRRISLEHTHVTDAGVAELKSRLPGVRIHR